MLDAAMRRTNQKDHGPLAMDGGTQAITLEQDPLLRWPVIGEEEREMVASLLDTSSISSAPVVDELTGEFAKFTGTKHAIAHVNGTACMFAAFHACGIGPGDEVIAPANTYWATVMPAAFLGARIVFCESERDSLCIDPDDIERKITPKTKAIVPVHVYGHPCDMDRIMSLATSHGIDVIEDASHAHGTSFRGKKIGSFGRCAAFSLQGSKVIPAGEGGILVTNDDEVFEQAILLGHYERVADLPSDNKRYNKTGYGFKHRLSPLHAAIALCQLRRFPEVNARITRNCERFRAALKDVPGTGFHVPDVPGHVDRGYFMNQLVYEEGNGIIPREDLTFVLVSEGLRVGQSRYELLHRQPYFVERGSNPDDLAFTRDLVGRLVSFPNFPWDLDGALVDEYIAGVEKAAFHLKDEL